MKSWLSVLPRTPCLIMWLLVKECILLAELVALLVEPANQTWIYLLRLFGSRTLLQNVRVLYAYTQLCFCVLKIAGKFRFEFVLTARVRLIMKSVLSQHSFAGVNWFMLRLRSLGKLVLFFDSLLAIIAGAASWAHHSLCQAIDWLEAACFAFWKSWGKIMWHSWDWWDTLGSVHQRWVHNLGVVEADGIRHVLFTIFI